MINTPRSPLDNPGTSGLYYTMLLSTRHHHESLRDDLPACAQELNTAMIDLLAASQDVIGLMLAQDANPGLRRYEQRIAEANDHLNDVWANFIEVSGGALR